MSKTNKNKKQKVATKSTPLKMDMAYKSNFKIEIDGIDSKHIANFTLPNMDDFSAKSGRISVRFHCGAIKEVLEWHQSDAVRAVKILLVSDKEEKVIASMDFNGQLSYCHFGGNWMKDHNYSFDDECYDSSDEGEEEAEVTEAAPDTEKTSKKNKKPPAPIVLHTDVLYDRLSVTVFD